MVVEYPGQACRLRRRQQLLAMVEADAAIILAAAPLRLRSGDVAWPYRQDSDFYYLCDLSEPAALLLLLPGRVQGECILFCRDKDRAAEHLHGPRLGLEAAVERLAVDDAFPIDDADDIVPGLLEGRTAVYGHFGRDPAFDRQLQGWLARLRRLQGGGTIPVEVNDLSYLMHDLRLYKAREEQSRLRRAVRMTTRAMRHTIEQLRVGWHEYQVEATFLYHLRMQGGQVAFPPTVAAGEHACIGHHRAGSRKLKAYDLLLLDGGGEVDGYAADIARTIPVSGRFSRPQRALYDVVWQAQQAAFAEIRPGRAFAAAHAAAVRVITEGLCRLGLLRIDPEEALEQGLYRRFFPYKTGHWLGLDVHDVGDYRVAGQSRVLEPNMVLTVEPGLYIQPDDTDVAPHWRGIGIRIEDDVLVTRTGCSILSAHLPSEAAAIEALCRG